MNKSTARFTKVANLNPESVGVNLVLKVDSVFTRLETIRGDKVVPIVDCSVGDETGSIVLSLEGDNTRHAVEGKTVVLRNAQVVLRDGFLRIELNDFAKISDSPINLKTPVRRDFDLSSIEHEFVRVE
eukprot:Lankesteria_metandrocarpae@DN5319_c0_g1_i2.p5